MILATPDGQKFSLHVERYEFPDEELIPTDDNPATDFDTGRFLMVTVSINTPEGEWNATRPEMTTTELERLADWLETVLKGDPSCDGVYFTERDLEIGFDEGSNSLMVHLFWDFLPQWMAKDSHLTIAFQLERINLPAAISSLRSQLERFPGRPMPEG